MANHPHTASGLEKVMDVWHRRRRLGLGVFAVLISAAASLAAFLPDVYRSTATVLIERHHVPESFVRSSVTGELETRLQTISQEVLSRARLEALIGRFDLYRDVRRRTSMEAAVQAMRRDIRIDIKSVDQPSGRGATIAFRMSYRGRDPALVATVTNLLASFYVEENVRLREQQASATTAFLRGQLADTKARLDTQERRVSVFRSRWVGELPEQLAVNMATIERLHTQLHLVGANQLRALDRRAALEKQLAEVAPDDGATNPETTAARLAKLKQELSELRRQYTDRYPDVARLRADIAERERDLGAPEPSPPLQSPVRPDPTVRRLQTALRDADAEIAALKAEDQRLRRDIEAYQRRVESAPQREHELQELSRDYETLKDLYPSLLKRYEDAQLAETMEQNQRGEQFRVLDRAISSTEPAAPNRLRLLLVGLVLAAGGAAAAMLTVERLDTSFHTVDHLRAFSLVPVLVSIPLIVDQTDARRNRRRSWCSAVAVTLLMAVVVRASQYFAEGNHALVGLMVRGGP
jgi:succinoglycan biosynthesis transport protein ExoP